MAELSPGARFVLAIKMKMAPTMTQDKQADYVARGGILKLHSARGDGPMMKIGPLNECLLAKRVAELGQTAGGLYIPDTAKEMPFDAVVVAVGIVPVAESRLTRCAATLRALQLDDDRRYGMNIIEPAPEEPPRQIAYNSVIDVAIVVNNVREATGTSGRNAATGACEELIKARILDPTKVVRVALQDAASLAALILTTEALNRRAPQWARSSQKQTE